MIGLEGSHIMVHTVPWRPLTSGVLHGSVLVPVPLIFTNRLEEMTVCPFVKFARREMEKQTKNLKEKHSARECNWIPSMRKTQAKRKLYREVGVYACVYKCLHMYVSLYVCMHMGKPLYCCACELPGAQSCSKETSIVNAWHTYRESNL